jgi:UDP-GlcNAc:undecaprenyl-phosphate GlcNAc-1-phosphate transferase
VTTSIAAPALAGLVLSLLLVPLCKRVAFRLDCVARPRGDRWHSKPTPLFGGVAIGLAAVPTVLFFGPAPELVVLLSCAAFIFIVGLIDDVISLKPSTKLIVEIVLASTLLFFGFRLNWLESTTLDSFLTLVWVVGLTNAFNLLDNMDGLCGGLAIIVGAALLVEMVSAGRGQSAEAIYLAGLIGATAGFLVYNINPASIFMGDSGSLLLGFSFAALTLNAEHAAAGRSNLLSIVAAPVLVLLIPIFDTTLVTVMRTLSGRKPSMGGRDHSSHRLVAIGLSERSAVAVLWLLAATGGAIGLGMKFFNQSWTALAAALFLIGMALFAVYLARIRVYEDTDQRIGAAGVTPIVVDFMYKRRVAEVLLDFSLVAVSYYLAYRLRFEGEDFLKEFRSFTTSLPVVVAAQLVAFFVVGVYRGVWRHFGLMDAVTVFKGVVLGTAAAQLFLLYIFRFFSYSRTVFIIYGVTVLGLVTLSRASFRLVGEFVQRQRTGGRRAVIYGAGDSAPLAIRELHGFDGAVKVLGFIDDDPRVTRMRFQGYTVLGDFRALELLVSTNSVDLVVVGGSTLAGDRVAALQSLCAEHGVSLMRLTIGFEELVTGASAAEPSPIITPTPFRKVKP